MLACALSNGTVTLLRVSQTVTDQGWQIQCQPIDNSLSDLSTSNDGATATALQWITLQGDMVRLLHQRMYMF